MIKSKRLKLNKFGDKERNGEFCCMLEPWLYKSQYAEADALVYSLKHDGFLHTLIFDSPSRVCEHRIDEKKGADKKGRAVLWDRRFSLVPDAFLGSEPPHIDIDTKVLLDEGIFLCYKGKNRQHLFQSVYLSARNIAERKPFVVFFWWYAQTAYVIVFAKQQLQFANIFEVQSASEVAYFVLAAAQECGIHQEKFDLVGDADADAMQQLDLELVKLSLGVEAITHHALYPEYFRSPHQILSGYLYHMPQCALPEGY